MSFSKYLLGASLAMAITFDAKAISVSPLDLSNPPVLLFTSPSQSIIDGQIAAYFANLGLNPAPSLVYKQNFKGSEEGSLAGSYTTTFNSLSDPSGGTIDWLSGPAAHDTIYLLVKDGNQNPSAYLFNITGWNGTDDLSFSDFWPGPGGSVSHVSIYASRVPDGGTTLMLLGNALLALGVVRRVCRARAS